MTRSSSPLSRSVDASPSRNKVRWRVFPSSLRKASANDRYSYVLLPLRARVVFTNIPADYHTYPTSMQGPFAPTNRIRDPQSQPKPQDTASRPPTDRENLSKSGLTNSPSTPMPAASDSM